MRKVPKSQESILSESVWMVIAVPGMVLGSVVTKSLYHEFKSCRVIELGNSSRVESSQNFQNPSHKSN